MQKQWTGIEIRRARASLEHACALVLGRMFLEFSRLDMSLGLALVCSGEGNKVETLTKQVEDLSFQQKLRRLEQHVARLYKPRDAAHSLYGQWLTDADSTRRMRNDLVHGRWGVDPIKDQVVNVVGLPTSSTRRVNTYAISDLKKALHRVQQLERRLSQLRRDWPV